MAGLWADPDVKRPVCEDFKQKTPNSYNERFKAHKVTNVTDVETDRLASIVACGVSKGLRGKKSDGGVQDQCERHFSHPFDRSAAQAQRFMVQGQAQ